MMGDFTGSEEGDFTGSEDITMHIRFGEPVPTRPFPDPEAARTYVLSGLDAARNLLEARSIVHRECYVLAGKVIAQILELRSHVAAVCSAPPVHLSAVCTYHVLREILGNEARAMRKNGRRRIRRLRLKRLVLFCVCVLLGFMIVPRAWIAPAMLVIWRLLWNDAVQEEVSGLKKKVAVAAEIERAALRVAWIVRHQTNLVDINF